LGKQAVVNEMHHRRMNDMMSAVPVDMVVQIRPARL